MGGTWEEELGRPHCAETRMTRAVASSAAKPRDGVILAMRVPIARVTDRQQHASKQAGRHQQHSLLAGRPGRGGSDGLLSALTDSLRAGLSDGPLYP